MWMRDSVSLRDISTLASSTEDLPLVPYGFWGAYTRWTMQSNSYGPEYKLKYRERRWSPEDLLWKDIFDPNKKDNIDTSLAPAEMEIKLH